MDLTAPTQPSVGISYHHVDGLIDLSGDDRRFLGSPCLTVLRHSDLANCLTLVNTSQTQRILSSRPPLGLIRTRASPCLEALHAAKGVSLTLVSSTCEQELRQGAH
eukprot:1195298-Prorocentrum_minimum.AAC.1